MAHLLQLVAGGRVSNRRGEENDSEDNHQQIKHGVTLHCLYHGPCFWPNHQIRPSVAVFCCLLSFSGASVRKNGWLEKSRRHSIRARNPSTNLYSAVAVDSLSAWVKPLNSPPRSDRYSPRPITANFGASWYRKYAAPPITCCGAELLKSRLTT